VILQARPGLLNREWRVGNLTSQVSGKKNEIANAEMVKEQVDYMSLVFESLGLRYS
jgi:hypothetical protein